MRDCYQAEMKKIIDAQRPSKISTVPELATLEERQADSVEKEMQQKPPRCIPPPSKLPSRSSSQSSLHAKKNYMTPTKSSLNKVVSNNEQGLYTSPYRNNSRGHSRQNSSKHGSRSSLYDGKSASHKALKHLSNVPSFDKSMIPKLNLSLVSTEFDKLKMKMKAPQPPKPKNKREESKKQEHRQSQLSRDGRSSVVSKQRESPPSRTYKNQSNSRTRPQSVIIKIP